MFLNARAINQKGANTMSKLMEQYKWARKLRADYRNGVLPQKEIELWNNLGFIWDTEEALHRSMFLSFPELVARERNKLNSNKCIGELNE